MRHLRLRKKSIVIYSNCCANKNFRFKPANFFIVCGTQVISYVVKDTKVSESTVSIKTEHYEFHKGRLNA